MNCLCEEYRKRISSLVESIEHSIIIYGSNAFEENKNDLDACVLFYSEPDNEIKKKDNQ